MLPPSCADLHRTTPPLSLCSPSLHSTHLGNECEDNFHSQTYTKNNHSPTAVTSCNLDLKQNFKNKEDIRWDKNPCQTRSCYSHDLKRLPSVKEQEEGSSHHAGQTSLAQAPSSASSRNTGASKRQEAYQGNGACLPAKDRLRMNTNGLGRDAMTGSSVPTTTSTSTTESAPWRSSDYSHVISSARAPPLQGAPLSTPPPPQHHQGALEQRESGLQAPRPLPERVASLILPPPHPSQDSALFRPPLTPPSPGSRPFPPPPHDPFVIPLTTAAPGFPATAAFAQLQQFYNPSFEFPTSLPPSLHLEPSYADMFARLRAQSGGPLRLQLSSMSGPAPLHLSPFYTSLPGSHRAESPSQRQAAHTSQTTAHPPMRFLKSPEEVFRHPLLPSHLRQHTPPPLHPQQREGALLMPPSYSRPSRSLPPSPSHSVAAHFARAHALTEDSKSISGYLSRDPKRPRLSAEGAPDLPALHRSPSLAAPGSLFPPVHVTHTVTATVTTSTTSTATHVLTSAQHHSASTAAHAHRYRTHPAQRTVSASATSVSGDPSAPAVAEGPAPPSSQLHYPPHFMRGSIIQLATGELKRVEDLKTEHFVNSANISPDLKIDSSQVEHIDERPGRGTVVLGFSVGAQKLRVNVEAAVEHPFFIFDHGWSSCSPEKTQQRYGLRCLTLRVGDICISLTKKQTVTIPVAPSEQGQPVEASTGTEAGPELSQQDVRVNGALRAQSTESAQHSTVGTESDSQYQAIREEAGTSTQERAQQSEQAGSSESSRGSSTSGYKPYAYQHHSGEALHSDTSRSGGYISGRQVEQEAEEQEEEGEHSASGQYVSVDSPGSPLVFPGVSEQSRSGESHPHFRASSHWSGDREGHHESRHEEEKPRPGDGQRDRRT